VTKFKPDVVLKGNAPFKIQSRGRSNLNMRGIRGLKFTQDSPMAGK
jgi:hypothetical protein